MPEPIDYANTFGVSIQGEHVTVLAGWRLRTPISREAALNLAAWLLALADAPLAFEHVSVHVGEPDVNAVLSAEFVELLGKVQQS